MMKKKLLYALLALASLDANAQSLTPMFPNIECGQLLFRAPATLTLNLRNMSSTPVSIKNIDTGCGCIRESHTGGDIKPNEVAEVKVTMDCNQLGHFTRIIRIFDSASKEPAEVTITGQIVAKKTDYTGDYPCKMGALLTDVSDIEFDDINQGQRYIQEIHIMNPTGQNVQPTMLRLPSFLSAEMKPQVLGPQQKGIMYITLNSQDLHDYGLTQSSFFIGKDPADKISQEKEITASVVLLPPAVAQDDVSRPYAARLSMSSKEIDMTELQKKSKVKSDIIITNKGKSDLKITKLQLFTPGLQVELGNPTIAPGVSTKLKVTGIAKELKKVRKTPRILMITNDPDNQKVVIPIKK